MPAPTNTTALTAIDIGTILPYSTTQNAHDAGTTYPLWYRYTAQPGDDVIGVFGFGDLVTYKPTIGVYIGPAAAPVKYPTVALWISVQNKAVQIPVTPGTTYYFAFTPNAGNPTPALLLLEIERAPTGTLVPGTLVVPDDTFSFPPLMITPAGALIGFVSGIPGGEYGDLLATGIVLFAELLSAATNKCQLHLYTSALASITTLTFNANLSQFIFVRANVDTDQFYVVDGFSVGTALAKTVTQSGSYGPTSWTLPANLSAITPALDDSALYFAVGTDSTIRTWTLATDTEGAVLVAAIVGYKITDLITLADGTIVAAYQQPGAPRNVVVHHYDATGGLLHTYPFVGISTTNSFPRLSRGLTDPLTVWYWYHEAGTGLSTFVEIEVATGVHVNEFTRPEFEAGIYQPATTATPLARFGPSFSCPFIIARVASGSITVIKTTSPGGLPDLFDFTAGGGLSPGSFQLADGGSQLYDPVDAGSGYSIEETPAPGFSTSITVSNGSPNTNISVGAGEDVVVAVLNAQQVQPGGGDGCPLGAPAAVAGEDGCTIPDDF